MLRTAHKANLRGGTFAYIVKAKIRRIPLHQWRKKEKEKFDAKLSHKNTVHTLHTAHTPLV